MMVKILDVLGENPDRANWKAQYSRSKTTTSESGVGLVRPGPQARPADRLLHDRRHGTFRPLDDWKRSRLPEMSLQRLFQKTLFGIFFLFGMIGVATSVLCIRTVDSYLSREYEANSKGIAKTIADASVDIILNRDLSVLQSLIDQFVEIQGISYIYITDETGEFLAHTFVPGVPEEIRTGYTGSTETVERRLRGLGTL